MSASPTKPTKTKLNASVRWPLGALTLTATAFALTGCANGLTDETSSRLIYSPRVLTLKSGQPVQTPAGIYTPQVDELWHHDAAFREMERRLLDAGFQVNELRRLEKEK
jgi:hypothetical protein